MCSFLRSGGLSFYYSEWVKTLTPEFPAGIIMAAVLGLAVTTSPILTFLKEADIVFLLPLETRLKSYFAKSIRVSFLLQGYILLMMLAAFMPMHFRVNSAALGDFIIALILLCVLKYLNLQVRFRILKYDTVWHQHIDSVVRYCLNAACLYMFFTGAHLLLVLAIPVLFLLLFLYFERETAGKPLKWERLISLEARRMGAFYRFANLFTDVPKLRERVARRKYLDWIVSAVPFRQNSSHLYLFSRTLIRSNDYLGLAVRLTVIGAVISLVFASIWAKLIVVLFALYLTGIQILPIARHHDNKLWLNLYPLPPAMKKKAALTVIDRTILIQAIAFSAVVLAAGNPIGGAACLGAGLIFLAIFHAYAKKKMAAL
ncbi:ABC transporter permease [Peribacillus sp. SCS-26]|uniref:ABC transporter permease n=1 Tax=Paraperibacillus marinus TaxID=3115295 RepID=UPI003906C11E